MYLNKKKKNKIQEEKNLSTFHLESICFYIYNLAKLLREAFYEDNLFSDTSSLVNNIE